MNATYITILYMSYSIIKTHYQNLKQGLSWTALHLGIQSHWARVFCCFAWYNHKTMVI